MAASARSAATGRRTPWADGFKDTWMQQLDQQAGADRRAMTAAERRIAGSKMQLETLGLSARQAGDLVGIASLG